jgi:hypothetical protein
MTGGAPVHAGGFNLWIGFHSTSRITLRRFIRSRACTTSFLSSTARRRSTVRVASRGPGSMYSPRMRLASSRARRTVSWSGLFMTPRNSLELGFKVKEEFSFPLAVRFNAPEAVAISRALSRQPRPVSVKAPARLGLARFRTVPRQTAP